MTKGEKADKIILQYQSLNRNLTAKKMFQAIPKKALVKLIKLLEAVKKQGATEPNFCRVCKSLHNNGNWNYNFRMKMLDRAEQTLAGIWR